MDYEQHTLIDYEDYQRGIKEEWWIGFTTGVMLTGGLAIISWLIF